MKRKYVEFVTDEHLLKCIKNLHFSYLKAKAKISKKKFYTNKIDTIKLTFDAKLNKLDEETIIKTENSALSEINEETEKSRRTLIDQITFENYSYYLGFDEL